MRLPEKIVSIMQFVKRHKILAVVLGLPVLLVALLLILISPFILAFIRNEITARNFARPFLDYPLPPQTTEISNSTNWGLLPWTGNGNHCDYEANRVLRTELSQPEIEAYYANVEFLPVVPGRSGFAAMWGRNGMLGVDVNFDPTHSAIVTISLRDGVYAASIWDIRCH